MNKALAGIDVAFLSGNLHLTIGAMQPKVLLLLPHLGHEPDAAHEPMNTVLKVEVRRRYY
jgi:hypothetical protein